MTPVHLTTNKPPPRTRWSIPASRLIAALAVSTALISGCATGGDDAAPPVTTAADAPSAASSPTTLETVVTVLDRPTAPIVVAHRGASGYAPEHTFAAYDLARQEGADYLEQDIQMTADGELVVLHDPSLDRTARGPSDSCTGLVADKTLAQIQVCDVGSWFNEANPERADPAFVGLKIPTLAEVIERYGPDVRYYIEIKEPGSAPGMEDTLLRLLDDANLTAGAKASRQIYIQSFSADSLRAVHAERPDLPLVQLLRFDETPIDDAQLEDIATYAVAIGPLVANVDPNLVAHAHTRCLAVHPYTVNDPAEMEAQLDIGVDGMFTNFPDLLVAQRAGRPLPEHCGNG